MRFVPYLSCIAMVALLFSACKQNDSTSIIKSAAPVTTDSIIGTYSGDFNGSPIAITLRYVSGKHVSGYNMHKGLKRNMAGTMELEGKQLHFHLSEPGTNKYDGVFDFLLDTTSWKGNGTWQAMHLNNGTVSFTLKKQFLEDAEWSWGVFRDTLGNYLMLKRDKSCEYSYVADDSTSKGQAVVVTGTFKFEKDSIIVIDWQPNEIFPSRKSVFPIIKRYEKDDPDRERPPLKNIYILGKEFSEFYD